MASDDVAVGERGPDGETLRVTALAAAGGRLFVGTPEGVYVVNTPLRSQVASWRPLVFGAPGASSNVVTALVAMSDGAVAGTDDGGLVFVGDETIAALPFAEARANDVNPGALARRGDRLLVGTEGAGLIALDDARHAHRIGGRGRISAVAAGAQIWFGSDDGVLYSLAPPASAPAGARQTVAASRIFCMSAP